MMLLVVLPVTRMVHLYHKGPDQTVERNDTMKDHLSGQTLVRLIVCIVYLDSMVYIILQLTKGVYLTSLIWLLMATTFQWVCQEVDEIKKTFSPFYFSTEKSCTTTTFLVTANKDLLQTDTHESLIFINYVRLQSFNFNKRQTQNSKRSFLYYTICTT